MSLKDLIAADVAAVFLNTDDFATEITLTKPTGGATEYGVNRRLFAMGFPPLPDGALSAYDRLHLLGFDRVGEGGGGPVATTIAAIVELDNEGAAQGENLDSPNDRRELRFGLLHVAADVEVTTAEEAELCDTATIDGQVWQILRPDGRDEAMVSYLIRRDEKLHTKFGRQRP